MQESKNFKTLVFLNMKILTVLFSQKRTAKRLTKNITNPKMKQCVKNQKNLDDRP